MDVNLSSLIRVAAGVGGRRSGASAGLSFVIVGLYVFIMSSLSSHADLVFSCRAATPFLFRTLMFLF